LTNRRLVKKLNFDLNEKITLSKEQQFMNYIKTGLIVSTIIIFLSVMFLQYDALEVRTVRDVFIIPAFIINVSLIFKVFKKNKQLNK
jgi:hypothetical protein